MAAGLEYLYDLAEDLRLEALDAIDVPRTGRALPCITYVSKGPPAIDSCCDCGDAEGGGGMLTVHLGSDRDPLDFTPPDANNCNIAVTANLTITLVRCVPTQTGSLAPVPPDDAALAGSALEQYGDLWALVTYLLGRRHAADFLPGHTCKGITFDSVEELGGGPSGGCAGWAVSLRVGLNDRGPQPGS